jgi:hypothetical protein
MTGQDQNKTVFEAKDNIFRKKSGISDHGSQANQTKNTEFIKKKILKKNLT